MTRYISAQHEACSNAFTGLFRVLDTDDPEEKVYNLAQLSDDFDRFSVWAANLGAGFRGTDYKRSLDYRLKEAEALKEAILKILQRIEALLRELTEAIQNGDEHEGESVSSNSDSQDDEQLHGGDNDVDSSWSLSSDEDLDPEAPSSPPGQSNATFLSFHPTAGRPPWTLASSHGSPSKLDILLRSLNYSITALYKIPVRSSNESRARHLGRRYDVEVSYYEPFDTSFVRDVFRDADERVIHRLGRLVTRRRQILRTRSLRNQELQRDALNSTQKSRTEIVEQANTSSPDPVIASETPEERGEARSAVLSTGGSSLKATTFKPSGPLNLGGLSYLNPAPSEVAESVSSVATTRAVQDVVIVPPRPVKTDGTEKEDFECPYCCTLVHCRSSHSWKKHVLNDLQPYSCTDASCEAADTMFEDREAWYMHELQHLSRYHCGTSEHASFGSGTAFTAHMQNGHPALGIGQLSTGVLNMFLKPSDTPRTFCPLCLGESKDLKRHLGRHLARVALFSLPRNHGDVEDNDAASQGSNKPAAAARLSDIGQEDSLTKSSDSGSGFNEDRDATHDLMRAKWFCHECDNEWYRDLGVHTCPKCRSEFTEAIDGGGSGAATVPTVSVQIEPIPDSDPTTWEQIKPELYVRPVPHDDSTTARESREMSGDRESRGQWNIIAAVHDTNFADQLRPMLQALDCSIYEAATETSLFDLLHTATEFHLLLLDVKLPHMSLNLITRGEDVAEVDIVGVIKAVRDGGTVSSSMPIVGMFDDRGEIWVSRDMFTSILQKPITGSQLQEILRLYCSGPETQIDAHGEEDQAKTQSRDWSADWATCHSLRTEDLKGHHKKEIEYQNALHEVVTTEHSYINQQLALLRELYQAQLRDWDQSTREIYKKMQELTFEPAAEIEEIHRSCLWPRMLERLSGSDAFVVGLSDCFVDWLGNARPAYLKYASSYAWAELAIKTEAEDNPEFKRYLTRCHQDPRSRKLSWETFVKAPITRLQRYRLLFQYLSKSLSRFELSDQYLRESEKIASLLDDLRTFVSEVDSILAAVACRVELKRYDQLLAFRSGINGRLDLLNDARRIVYKGGLLHQRESRFGAKRDVVRHVVLFDNYLVISKPFSTLTKTRDGRQGYDVTLPPIPIQLLSLHHDSEAMLTLSKNMTAEPPQPADLTTSITQHVNNPTHVFWVQDLGTGTTYSFGASSRQSKVEWKQAIMEMKEQHCDGPFTVKLLKQKRLDQDKTSGLVHVPIQPSQSSFGIAIEGRSRIVGRASSLALSMRLKVNCMTPLDEYSTFLIGSDDGVYTTTFSGHTRRLVEQSEVKKIVWIPQWTAVFVLAKARLYAYHAVNLPQNTSNLDGPVDQKPLQLLQEEQILGTTTSDFTMSPDLTSVRCIAIKSGITSKELVFIQYSGDSDSRRRAVSRFRTSTGASTRYSVTHRNPISVDGSLIFVRAGRLDAAVVIGTSKTMISYSPGAPPMSPWFNLPSHDAGQAIGRVADHPPLAFFVDPQSSPRSGLAVYDNCALYMTERGSLTRSVILDFVSKGKAASKVGLYLVIVHDDFLEIRDIETGELIQIVEGCEIRMLNQDDFIFSSRISDTEEVIAKLELAG